VLQRQPRGLDGTANLQLRARHLCLPRGVHQSRS
jgi:hypothetical protein